MRCNNRAQGLLLLAAILHSIEVYAQPDTLRPEQADSLGLVADVRWEVWRLDLGRPTPARIQVQYPAHYTLLLPDTAKGYPGFECVQQKYSRRRSGSRAHDSLWVELRSWEIYSRQVLLPVFRVVMGADTFFWIPPGDTVAFAARVQNYSPSLPLKPDYTVLLLRSPHNWFQTFAAIFGVGGLLAITTLLAFRPLRRSWLRRRLRRRFANFRHELALHYGRAQENPLEGLNNLNTTWKVWLEEQWQIRLQSRTARELSRVLQLRRELAQEYRVLLYRLNQAEEQLNYAQQPLEVGWLPQVYPQLLRMLEEQLHQRLAAIR